LGTTIGVKTYFCTSPMSQRITRHIPNFLTCLNLFCGCLALVYVFKGQITVFAILVGASLVFDFLDGFTARALKAYSPMGRELDSLADMVTFGVLPGAIMYHMFALSLSLSNAPNESWTKVIGYLPFLITVFSGLRLAKFNIDTRQTISFLGMPTPAVTIFVVGLALIVEYDRYLIAYRFLDPYVIGGLSLVLSFLLVSEIPLFAFKFRNFIWEENKAQFTLLAIAVILVPVLGVTAIPLLVIFYLILSLINNYYPLNRQPRNIENP
jgi:CDP-diacylglycerol---serine O-phosphatidyltransferase